MQALHAQLQGRRGLTGQELLLLAPTRQTRYRNAAEPAAAVPLKAVTLLFHRQPPKVWALPISRGELVHPSHPPLFLLLAQGDDFYADQRGATVKSFPSRKIFPLEKWRLNRLRASLRLRTFVCQKQASSACLFLPASRRQSPVLAGCLPAARLLGEARLPEKGFLTSTGGKFPSSGNHLCMHKLSSWKLLTRLDDVPKDFPEEGPSGTTELSSQGQMQTSSPNGRSLASSLLKSCHPLQLLPSAGLLSHSGQKLCSFSAFPSADVPTTELHPRVVSNPQTAHLPASLACSLTFSRNESRRGDVVFSPPAVATRLRSPARSACQDTEAGAQGVSRCTPEPRSSGRAPHALPVPTLTGLLPRHSEAQTLQAQVSVQQTALPRGWRNSLAGPSRVQRDLSVLCTTQQSSPSRLLSRRDSGDRYQEQSACSGCWYPCWDAGALTRRADRPHAKAGPAVPLPFWQINQERIAQL